MKDMFENSDYLGLFYLKKYIKYLNQLWHCHFLPWQPTVLLSRLFFWRKGPICYIYGNTHCAPLVEIRYTGLHVVKASREKTV
jgi:hypothetical protein